MNVCSFSFFFFFFLFRTITAMMNKAYQKNARRNRMMYTRKTALHSFIRTQSEERINFNLKINTAEIDERRKKKQKQYDKNSNLLYPLFSPIRSLTHTHSHSLLSTGHTKPYVFQFIWREKKTFVVVFVWFVAIAVKSFLVDVFGLLFLFPRHTFAYINQLWTHLFHTQINSLSLNFLEIFLLFSLSLFHVWCGCCFNHRSLFPSSWREIIFFFSAIPNVMKSVSPFYVDFHFLFLVSFSHRVYVLRFVYAFVCVCACVYMGIKKTISVTSQTHLLFCSH